MNGSEVFADGVLAGRAVLVTGCTPLGAALSGSVVTLDGGRDNWFGPWPPENLAGEDGEVPAEARGPKPPGS